MLAFDRTTIVLHVATARRLHAIGFPNAWILSHAVMGAIEAHVGNAIVTLNSSGLLEAGGKVVGDLAEDSDLAFDNLFLMAVLHVAGDVIDESLLCAIIEHLLPQVARCIEILWPNLREVGYRVAYEVAMDLVEIHRSLPKLHWLDRAEIRWTGALVVICHGAITLKVRKLVRYLWRIDGKLLVVGTDAMAVGIRIGKETRLQDWVCGWLNPWRHMRWAESNLLDFCEIVFDVLVQEELSDLAKRELLLRPNVRKIKYVDFLLLPELLSFLWSHRLEHHIPSWIVTLLDGVVEILLCEVWRIVCGILLGDESSALLALHVHLGIHPLTLLVDELKGVACVAMHLSPTLWNTTVTHEDHDLVDRLWILRKVVPEHGGIIRMGHVRSRVALLSVDEVRELGGIPQEEDWSVVGNHVPVPLRCAELDRKASWVPCHVVRTRFATDGGEPDGDRTLLVCLENLRKTEVIQWVGGLIISVCATTLGVNDTLGDALTVEMGDQID